VGTLFYILNAGVLILLLFLSGVVSGSEVALFSLSANDVVDLQKGGKNEKKILSLVSSPQRLLATILILNNTINVAIVTISTYLSWEIYGTKSLEGELMAAMTAIITFAIVFFGEVVPKIFANQRNLKFAYFSLPLLSFSFFVFKPIAWLLTNMTNMIEKRIENKEFEVSIDELNQAVELTTQEGATEEEKGILKGLVNFGQLTVKQVMRSRIDITAFDNEMDFHELMDKINKTGFSRIPVYHETIDRIIGILYNKDLLPFLDRDEKFEWQSLLRTPYFVPETKKIDTLLKDFQKKRVHMAIVVDEYGGTSGLLTLEDIIEEIVGEINDEYDDDEIQFSKINPNTYVFEGKTSLNDFCKVVEMDPSLFDDVKGESESLAGLILEINNKIPLSGQKIIYNRFEFTVEAVDQRRIKRVRVTLKA